jgi:hypothetical protein
VLEQVRGLYGMSTVAVVDPASDGSAPARLGPPPWQRPSLTVDATDGLQLTAYGPEVLAEDHRRLSMLAAMASRAWQGQKLAEQAAQARQLANALDAGADDYHETFRDGRAARSDGGRLAKVPAH